MDRHKKGFTLIELLVVISIIALLLSILMPSLQKAKELARGAVCSSNLHNIAVGLVTAANDHDDKYIPRKAGYPTCIARFSYYPNDEKNEYYNILDYWYKAVGGQSADIFWCPFERDYGPGTGYTGRGTGDREKWEPLFYTGNDGSYLTGYSIYAGWIWQNGNVNYLDWSESGNHSTSKPPTIAGLSKDVIVSDNNYAYLYNGYDRWKVQHGKKQRGDWASVGEEKFPIPPTFNNSNAAFGDGHVEKKTNPDNIRWVRVVTTDYRYFY